MDAHALKTRVLSPPKLFKAQNAKLLTAKLSTYRYITATTTLKVLGLSLLGWTSTSSYAAVTELEHRTTELQTIHVNALKRNEALDTSHLTTVSQNKSITMGALDLGTALKNQLGMNAQEFGAVSRPIMRGQTEPRVKIITNDTNTIDASDLSPDHASTVNPMLARAITVIKGPETLKYAGGAVTGVIDVETNDIPTLLPKNRLSGTGALRFDSAGNNFEQLISVDGALTKNWVVHTDFLHNDADDYKSPVSGQDTVLGTQNKLKAGSIGTSYIYDTGVIGLSYRNYKREYGLPGHNHEYDSCHAHGASIHCGIDGEEAENDHEHDHTAAEAPPTVDMRSNRYDFLWRQEFKGALEQIKLTANRTDYKHDELDGTEVMTTFKNTGHGITLDGKLREWNGFNSHIGYQNSETELGANGIESFLPTTKSKNNSVYGLTKYNYKNINASLSARYDHKKIDGADGSTVDPYKKHTVSYMGAVDWEFYPTYTVGLSLGHVKRMPQTQELYADGVHLATNTFEIGNSQLKPETNNSVELNFKKTFGKADFIINAYQHNIDDYIYAQTLDQFETFRLVKYTQQDATFKGGEAAFNYRFNEQWELGLFADRVRGSFNTGGNVPRMPADRFGVRAHYHINKWNAGLEWAKVSKQDRLADFEEETPGYHDVNASLSYLVKSDNDVQYRLFLEGRNLTDAVRYNSASYLTNIVPLPGRHFAGGIQVKF